MKTIYFISILFLTVFNISCGNRKVADKNTQPHPQFKIIHSAPEIWVNPRGEKINRYSQVFIILVSDNGNPIKFDDEKSYEKIIKPAIYALKFCGSFDNTNPLYNLKPISIDDNIALLNKYINYVFELPLTDQPIDEKIKEKFNQIYYNTNIYENKHDNQLEKNLKIPTMIDKSYGKQRYQSSSEKLLLWRFNNTSFSSNYNGVVCFGRIVMYDPFTE